MRHIPVAVALSGVLCVPAHADGVRDIGRDVLAPDDGWAAAGGGTTGGAAADDAHVYTVTDRAGLVRALEHGSDTPKIIKIAGTDDSGHHLDCADYATDGYRLKKYLAAYDPRTRGSAKPSGPQEEARQASAAKQAERVVLPVGSHTTLIGLGDAVLKGADLQVGNANNVIIRNLDLRDAYDCFPVRQPDTGGLGDWKTAYDTLTLTGATHVRADHITASDKGHPDSAEPTCFARNYLRHDGLLDITGGSDLVTVSWSRFADHDKAILIGNSDSATGDRGKLRVTLHHNQFESVVQRAPRVRFGQVHVYDNRYVVPEGSEYRYSLGVSTESALYAENNAFHTPSHVEAADLVKSWNGTALHQSGTLFNGYPVDLLALYDAYNSGSERDLTADVGRTPTLHGKIDSAAVADREVARGAGAGRIP
ncbi:pectate lyase [Streptomyces cellostaticus]|nr:pectate lyase [Streptomyces cellostaticus]